jgi:hypothetical protein
MKKKEEREMRTENKQWWLTSRMERGRTTPTLPDF